MSDESYSNTHVQVKPIRIEDLHDMCNRTIEQHRETLIQSFMGIKTVVDKKLTGLDYYIAISPELHAHLKERKP